ncbi:hypothetical protein [Candidatus Methylobacter oryzae]|uniref:Uncharacterized protein n=1 Tax=Candidatus Methylobacter oryzae TaxID=2497749 RepID=A0ABY3CB49_9GAMM|nr:hypothetical protein [Candidatus Methylobacter oryzae]TRW95822.1 hypothetical protein EKO24_009450 [Candidatus Methylobacter oryzae]
MSIQIPLTPNQEAQAMLDCLRLAVTKALDRKRRLGQYAVFWSEGEPIAVGEDAPVELKARKVSRD